MGDYSPSVSRRCNHTGLFGITEMNERIKKIWEDSEEIKVRYPEQGSPVSVSEQTLEKFAELIVKACADAADMAQDARCKYVGDYVAEQMGYGEEHGVSAWRTK